MAKKTDDRKSLTLRMSAEDYAAFKKAADDLDMPLTVWIRLACRKAAGLPTL